MDVHNKFQQNVFESNVRMHYKSQTQQYETGLSKVFHRPQKFHVCFCLWSKKHRLAVCPKYDQVLNNTHFCQNKENFQYDLTPNLRGQNENGWRFENIFLNKRQKFVKYLKIIQIPKKYQKDLKKL
mgnify:CR=1 FL=1